MAVWCSATGVFLMWLTKKTGSVFPAAIMHACNNMQVGSVNQVFLSGVGDAGKFEPTMQQSMLCMIPYLILAAVFAVIMIAGSRAKKPAEDAAV